jgi:hypothetical protein
MRRMARERYSAAARNITRRPRDMNIRPSSALHLAAVALSFTLSLGGCGQPDRDSPPGKVTSYQGKPDTPPWDGSRWHGDRQHWERDIDARAQNQNEYVRIPD